MSNSPQQLINKHAAENSNENASNRKSKNSSQARVERAMHNAAVGGGVEHEAHTDSDLHVVASHFREGRWAGARSGFLGVLTLTQRLQSTHVNDGRRHGDQGTS